MESLLRKLGSYVTHHESEKLITSLFKDNSPHKIIDELNFFIKEWEGE